VFLRCLLWTICFVSVSQVLHAGEISPTLGRVISSADPDSLIDTGFYLRSQRDVKDIARSHPYVGLRELRRIAMDQLRQHAEQSQAGLLQRMQAMGEGQRIESVRSA
jgi:hypothetical protein